jgi:hypothetical protein
MFDDLDLLGGGVPLAAQLDGTGLPDDVVRAFQCDVNAISQLYRRCYLTTDAWTGLRRALQQRIDLAIVAVKPNSNTKSRDDQ